MFCNSATTTSSVIIQGCSPARIRLIKFGITSCVHAASSLAPFGRSWNVARLRLWGLVSNALNLTRDWKNVRSVLQDIAKMYLCCGSQFNPFHRAWHSHFPFERVIFVWRSTKSVRFSAWFYKNTRCNAFWFGLPQFRRPRLLWR